MELLWLDVPRRTAVRIVGIKTDCYRRATEYPCPKLLVTKGQRGAQSNISPPLGAARDKATRKKGSAGFHF